MTLINRLIIVILYRPIKKSQQRETDLLRNLSQEATVGDGNHINIRHNFKIKHIF